jgi:hypothetical protein
MILSKFILKLLISTTDRKASSYVVGPYQNARSCRRGAGCSRVETENDIPVNREGEAKHAPMTVTEWRIAL